MAAGAAFTAGVTALAARSPKAGQALGSAAKILFGVDIANRLVETTAAGIDTWISPEHYEKNRATVGDFLGRGLLDYVGFGTMAVAGFSAGEMLFLRDDATALYRAFRNSEIPKLTKITFNRAIPGEEPVDSEAGKLFMSQKNNVVRIENEKGVGSGFFVDKDEGLVTTNYHVVRAAKKHTFSMDDGSQFSALARCAR